MHLAACLVSFKAWELPLPLGLRRPKPFRQLGFDRGGTLAQPLQHGLLGCHGGRGVEARPEGPARCLPLGLPSARAPLLIESRPRPMALVQHLQGLDSEELTPDKQIHYDAPARDM